MKDDLRVVRNNGLGSVVSMLMAYGKHKDLRRGIWLHGEILRTGLLAKNHCVAGALISMYSNCGALALAQQVFDELPVRDLVSWTALLAGYAHYGHGLDALECFELMKSEGHSPNEVTFTCILKACGNIGALYEGSQFHDQIIEQGLLQRSIVLGNALMDMYVKCGALPKARQMFDELLVRNVVTWNTLIAGYAKQGQSNEALKCFDWMQREGNAPTVITYTCILNACGNIGAVENGERIHDEIVKKCLLKQNAFLGNALVAMHAKCGALVKAKKVLDQLHVRDVITWSTLIAGYVQQGQGHEALECLDQMHREGHHPDIMTLTCTLKAAASIGAVDKGELLYYSIVRQGWLGKDVVIGTVVVDMYAKCGAFAKAQQVLYELPARNVASWNALIAGLSQQCYSKDVLNCFERMQLEGVSPDATIFVCVINACTHGGLMDKGHMYFEQMSMVYGIAPNAKHYCCMVDLYGRAGELMMAFAMIENVMTSCDLPIWHALFSACQNGRNVRFGKLVFDHAIQVDKHDSAAYIRMANLYVAAGKQENVSKFHVMRFKNNSWEVA